MLFNSYSFIFVFLPTVLAVYWWSRGVAKSTFRLFWLLSSSLYYYGAWKLGLLPILLASIVFNFLCARTLAILGPGTSRARWMLSLGVAGNLLVLGYFKYADFFMGSISALLGKHWEPAGIVLPIGISFFTFQQIAYLADVQWGKATPHDLAHYALFITFFPHLIAGPMLHHADMVPQLRRLRFSEASAAQGVALFVAGLAKKVVLADTLSEWASPIFNAAEMQSAISASDAWLGTLAYTFQLYFDFSGYSDMAIGLGLLFGVTLPQNFDSPYKARSAIEFWRRWHITLSRFLRDYVYFPLGGNRKGTTRRYVNLMVVMLLGGLWHGAGWTFVVWGGLHGLLLCINHLWSEKNGPRTVSDSYVRSGFSKILTFLAVAGCWVFFRAETLEGAWKVLSSMLSWSPTSGHALLGNSAIAGITVAACIVFFAPNTQQIFLAQPVEVRPFLQFRPNQPWAIFLATLFLASVLRMGAASEFLYFQF